MQPQYISPSLYTNIHTILSVFYALSSLLLSQPVSNVMLLTKVFLNLSLIHLLFIIIFFVFVSLQYIHRLTLIFTSTLLLLVPHIEHSAHSSQFKLTPFPFIILIVNLELQRIAGSINYPYYYYHKHLISLNSAAALFQWLKDTMQLLTMFLN